MKVRVRGLTDVGRVRETNEDALVICEAASATRPERGTLLAIADGMGGLGQGELASRLAIENLAREYYEQPGTPGDALTEAVEEANRAIFRYAQEEAGGEPMGSTMTALVLHEGCAHIAQVGDSRAYRYRDGTLSQLTRDHSLVRELADRGELDPDSMLYRQHRNVLTRGLGLREDVEVDLFELPDVAAGDLFLLSSDGLHEVLKEDEICAGIESHGDDLEALCRHLIHEACERGAPDNVTVALAKVTESEDAVPEAILLPERPRSWSIPIALFASFALGMVLTLFLSRDPARLESKLENARARLDDLLENLEEGTPAADDMRLRLEEIRDALAD